MLLREKTLMCMVRNKREREREREREQGVRHQSTKMKREIKWKVLDGVQKAERGNWQDEKRKKKKR